MTQEDEKARAKAKEILQQFLGLSEAALFTERDAVVRAVSRLADEVRTIRRPRLREHVSRLIEAAAEDRSRKFGKAFDVMTAEFGLKQRRRREDEIEVISEPAPTLAVPFVPSPSPP